MKKQPQVIDFFCGAGGFSEGFRQQGFHVVMGVDNWSPAIETHNLNHGLNDKARNVLDFESLDEIQALPDTEVIVGSPPCVLFSLSNKGGKSDKTLGIRLIEAYLRVIAVKKHQPSSKLKAWFMENVPNSRNYIKPKYTFRDLKLVEWAEQQGLDADQVALNGSQNGRILNTAEFGVSQKRERYVCGEIVSTEKFPDLEEFLVKSYKTIGDIKAKMPKPNLKRSKKIFADPNYPSLKFPVGNITDHFYDSGIYEVQWRKAQYLKLNHPFMGKMSFPENEDKPSRTIMATQSASTRESIIYKSEFKRKGDGEYRLPTIREIATMMGFPYYYQFSGYEGTKWRQVGNAVCPPMSSTLAKAVRIAIGLPRISESKIIFGVSQDNIKNIQNLNTFSQKKFDTPPKKKNNARFRRHPFKEGNMTVALTNYHPTESAKEDSVNWYSVVFHGTGKGFDVEILKPGAYQSLRSMILKHDSVHGKKFVKEFDKNFNYFLKNVSGLQSAYEDPRAFDVDLNPDVLIDKIANFIVEFDSSEFARVIDSPSPIAGRSSLPVKQLYAMYAINRIISSQ